KANSDYVAASGTVSFAPGQSSLGSGANEPPLRLVRVGDQFQLSWTSTLDVFDLQERDSLTVSSAWAKVNAPVTVTGNNYSVLVEMSAGSKFYRLVPRV